MADKIQFKSESFQVQEAEGDDEGKIVTGMALPYGETSRNGVQYDKDSVEENMDKMEGRSVLVNHDMDRPIGHVQEVQSTDEGMVYRMNIDPEEKINNTSAIRKFERGDVKNVSISAFVERVEGEDNLVEVKDFAELSAVTVPGFPQTSTNPEQAPQGVLAAESIEDWVSTYEDGDEGKGSDGGDTDENGEGENFKNREEESDTMGDNDNTESEDFSFEAAVAEMLAEAANVEVEEFSNVLEDYEFEADEAVENFVEEASIESEEKDKDDDEEDDDEAGDGDGDDSDDDDDMDDEDEAFLEVGDEEFSKEEVVEALKSDEDGEDDGEEEDADGDDSEDEGFGDGSTNQEFTGDSDNENQKEDFSDVNMPSF